MNIVLEGPDGGGKSTLALHLMEELNRNSSDPYLLQPGEGPPKFIDEINERLRRYALHKNAIFDRHPAVSQPIYSQLREVDNNMPDIDLVCAFYASKPLIIYCRSITAAHHVVKEGEDPTHIDALTKNYEQLVHLYDVWALQHAHFIYRIGQNIIQLADAVKEWCNHG